MAVVSLGVMLVNVVLPTGLTSACAYINYDWITLLVMAVVAVAGVAPFFAAHRRREIGAHMIDTDAPGQVAQHPETAETTEAPASPAGPGHPGDFVTRATPRAAWYCETLPGD